MDGWIKAYRKKLDWEWFTDVPTAHLFEYLLLAAEYEPRKWQGHSVEAGELITTVGSLAERTGLSNQQVRTALNKLQSTGEIILTSTNKYTLVKVQNYGIYQGYDLPEQQTNNKQSNKQITNEQQTNNNQHTIIKEIKNTRNKEYKDTLVNIVELFNQICVSLPKVKKLSETRKRTLNNAECDSWEELFKKVEASDFLTGRDGKWQASFDWVIQPRNIIKILEGNYDNRANGKYNSTDNQYEGQF